MTLRYNAAGTWHILRLSAFEDVLRVAVMADGAPSSGEGDIDVIITASLLENNRANTGFGWGRAIYVGHDLDYSEITGNCIRNNMGAFGSAVRRNPNYPPFKRP